MAETLLLDQAAGAGASRGAVAVVAATVESFTDANDAFNTDLFNSIQNSPGADLGTVFTQATNALIRDASGTLATDAAENVKMYLLFGDPRLKPWIE
jgi:hypothetical protein